MSRKSEEERVMEELLLEKWPQRPNEAHKRTIKRGEDGILYSYDSETGELVGPIYEHGVEPPKKGKKKADIDEIEEV